MNGGRARRQWLKAAAVTAAVATVPQARAAARRVISVGGGLTEIVYALGAGAELMATDTTSLHPEQAQATRKVGYLRALSAEGVLSLAPTLLLASHDAGPSNVIRQIEGAGVKVLRTTERYDFEGLVQRVTAVGDALERREAAQGLAQRLRTEWAAADEAVRGARERRAGRATRVVFVLAHAGAPVVAGRDTAADALIALAGGDNPLSKAFSGYKPMTPEALVEARPDLLLITSQGLEAQGGVEGILARPGVSLTPAGRNRRIVGLDALYLLGFGPRLPAVVKELAVLFANTAT